MFVTFENFKKTKHECDKITAEEHGFLELDFPEDTIFYIYYFEETHNTVVLAAYKIDNKD